MDREFVCKGDSIDRYSLNSGMYDVIWLAILIEQRCDASCQPLDRPTGQKREQFVKKLAVFSIFMLGLFQLSLLCLPPLQRLMILSMWMFPISSLSPSSPTSFRNRRMKGMFSTDSCTGHAIPLFLAVAISILEVVTGFIVNLVVGWCQGKLEERFLWFITS